MLSIKEVEAMTGITKQNIRYYEKQDLIHPNRNEENDYREYSENDVRILNLIKLFRKLDMPLEEIRKILSNDVELKDAMGAQKERLEKERQRLEDALNFCNKIQEDNIESVDVDAYLIEMAEEESHGAVFADLINDFRRISEAEAVRQFRFMPDTMCMTPQEFTDALCAYANENNVNLVITKEGMNPKFTIDDIEYTAERIFSRFGAVVVCQMEHPEYIIPADISEKKYKVMRSLLKWSVPVAVALFISIIGTLGSISKGEVIGVLDILGIIGFTIAIAIMWYVGMLTTYGYFRNMKN